MAVSVSYQTRLISTSDLTTYTFSSTAIGTESSDRQVVVAIVGRSSGASNVALSSVTIAGVAAAVISGSEVIVGRRSLEHWKASVPTGTTGDIVIVFGSAQTAASAGVWAVAGASTTVSDVDTNTGSGASISLTGLTVPASGGAIIHWTNATDSATTWTGATERFDASVETNFRHSGADTTTAGTNTITSDGATDTQEITGVAFGPASEHAFLTLLGVS